MKPLYSQVLSLVASVLVVWPCLPTGAQPELYAYTAPDGALDMSGAPADDRYALLVQNLGDPAPRMGVEAPPPAIPRKAAYDKVVAQVARAYGIEGALLHAVISVESHYRADAVSSKGAAGLMQLMPVITRRYQVSDPLDPVQNLRGGAQYLRYLLKVFDNNVPLALAAYNAGETAVAKYGNQIPPYRETTKYVPKVLGFYKKYRKESL